MRDESVSFHFSEPNTTSAFPALSRRSIYVTAVDSIMNELPSQVVE